MIKYETSNLVWWHVKDLEIVYRKTQITMQKASVS